MLTERQFDAYLQQYAQRTIPLYDFRWAVAEFAVTIERARAGR